MLNLREKAEIIEKPSVSYFQMFKIAWWREITYLRESPEHWIYLTMIWVVALLLGAIFTPITFQTAGLANFLALLFLMIYAAVQATEVYGPRLHFIHREVSVGFSSTIYFWVPFCVNIVEGYFLSSSFVMLFYWMTQPYASIYYYLLFMPLMYFVGQLLGYFTSMINYDQSRVVCVAVCILSGFFSGLQPSLREIFEEGGVQYFLATISPTRWILGALMYYEFDAFPNSIISTINSNDHLGMRNKKNDNEVE
jgi:hypothetical protein